MEPTDRGPAATPRAQSGAVPTASGDRDPWCCPPIGLRTPVDENRWSMLHCGVIRTVASPAAKPCTALEPSWHAALVLGLLRPRVMGLTLPVHGP